MPAPLAVDREAVKAHVVNYGVRETARVYGLPQATVSAWSARGKWLQTAGTVAEVQPLPVSMQPQKRDIPTPATAATASLEKLGEKSKVRLARGLARGALHVANMRPSKVVESAPQVKALVDAGAKLHGWGADTGSGGLLGIHVTVRPPEGAAIDVHAVVDRCSPAPDMDDPAF